MKWERWELVIILSVRRKTRAKVKQECAVCHCEIHPGDKCSSFGVIDRKYEKKERLYTCLEHSHVFDYTSIEDCEPWQQEFLHENRFCNEVWYG